jgi:hypothetical protein
MRAYLQTRRRSEFFVLKKLDHVVFGLDLITLVILSCSKCHREALVVPLLDVIVARFPSMDVSFNGISFITDDKTDCSLAQHKLELHCLGNSHDGIELVPDHGTDLLQCELNASISDEENSSTIALLFGGQCGSLASSH